MFQIKICGVTTADDARQVVTAGADAIGLNFCDSSPRFLSMTDAAAVVAAMDDLASGSGAAEPGPAAAKVGVFVNSSIDSIAEHVAELRIDFVQLHGDESPELVAALHHAIPATPLIRAFRLPRDREQELFDYLAKCPAGALQSVLIDAAVPGEFGGTGHQADWDWARSLRQRLDLPLILAGGLHSKNVAAAVAKVGSHAVDTASGVESSPGVKDADSVRAFVRAAQQALAE